MQPEMLTGDNSDNIQQSHIYRAQPHEVVSFGASGQPPFSLGQGVCPILESDTIAPKSGVQPVYHLKITAKPVRQTAQQNPKYNISVDSQTIYGTDRATVHVIPQMTLDANKNGQTIRNLETPPLIQQSSSSSYKDQLSSISGLDNTHVGSLVHTYRGTKPIGTDAVMGGLLGDSIQEKTRHLNFSPTSEYKSGNNIEQAESVPRQRGSSLLQVDSRDDEKTEVKNWWDKSASSLSREIQAQLDSATAAYKQIVDGQTLRYGTTSSFVQEEGLGEGIFNKGIEFEGQQITAPGKIIPQLVDADDEDKQRVFNWIVPEAASQILADEINVSRSSQGINSSTVTNSASNRKSNHGMIGNIFSWFSKRNKDSDRGPSTVADEPALHFTNSENLAEFLDKQNVGLVWEEGQQNTSMTHSSVHVGGEGSDDEDPVKPSIVYGGVEHAEPHFGGQLGTLTMRLHATETHQYIKVCGMPDPWFIKNGHRPEAEALHGPVALPYNPVYTGMPAPVYRGKETPVVEIAPIVRTWFEPVLPTIVPDEALL